MIAAISANTGPIVSLLLKNKADPNITNESKANPLYLAIRSGQADLVPELLQAGASAKTTTPEGQPVLNFFCQHYQSCGFDEESGLTLLRQSLSAGA
ncbi:MAG: ankyrin repeat protein, partial [Verrucomicrobiales bacterium]